jgi:hypothetical protein
MSNVVESIITYCNGCKKKVKVYKSDASYPNPPVGWDTFRDAWYCPDCLKELFSHNGKPPKKRWVVYASDLRVYNPTRKILGIIFGLIFLPVVLFAYIGDGAQWLAEKISNGIVDFLAAWITAIILHKKKEYR